MGLKGSDARGLLSPLVIEQSRRAVEALATEARTAIASHWRRRATSECRIGHGFAQMVPRLASQGAPADLIEHFEHASLEEAQHSLLCLELAGLYEEGAGLERPLEIEDVVTPSFDVDDDKLDLALLILGTCCINETLATAYIGACLETATVPCAVQANRHHLREEIGHGRLGWAMLSSPWLSASLREALVPCLPGMLAANLPLWLRPDPFTGNLALPALGHPPHAFLRERIAACVTEVIIPGFHHVGLPYRGPTGGWGETLGDAV